MRTLNNTWRRTLLASLILAASLSGCATRHGGESLVIPDSHELRPAYACEPDGDGTPTNCAVDPYRVTIDLGYLREIIDLLDGCAK